MHKPILRYMYRVHQALDVRTTSSFKSSTSRCAETFFEGPPNNFVSSKVERNEIAPGFTAQEFESRRARLMQSLPENSVVVSVASPVKYLSGG